MLRELLDKKLWKIPECIKERGRLLRKISTAPSKRYNPEYWRARQSGLKAAQAARREAPARLTER